MRLIDADALTEHMRKAYKGNKKNGFKWDLECAVAVIECEEEINQPIVRCKDCKYWEKEYDEYDGEEWWTCGKYEPYNSNDSMHEDDFCSRGEKK